MNHTPYYESIQRKLYNGVMSRKLRYDKYLWDDDEAYIYIGNDSMLPTAVYIIPKYKWILNMNCFTYFQQRKVDFHQSILHLIENCKETYSIVPEAFKEVHALTDEGDILNFYYWESKKGVYICYDRALFDSFGEFGFIATDGPKATAVVYGVDLEPIGVMVPMKVPVDIIEECKSEQ